MEFFLKKQIEKYRGIISSTTVLIETGKPTGFQVQSMAINRRRITGRSIFCDILLPMHKAVVLQDILQIEIYDGLCNDRVYKKYSAKHEYLE